jgi:L-fuconolactonase
MIDSHVHFWNFDPIRDNWITDDMSNIRKDFTPRDFTTICNTLPIEGCIAVQANQSENETEYLLALAKENPIIKGIVGWTDLCSNQLAEQLDYWANYKLIKGWRHVLQAEADEFILNDNFAAGVRTLNNYGFTYDLLCYHDQLPAILKLVDKLEDQPLVLDHCGKPDVKNQHLATWEGHIKILAENPNVSCKISGLLAEADWHNWTERQIFNCFDVIFKHFGVERVMYGSDWPVVLISRPYGDWFNLVKKYTQQFNANEQAAIFDGNVRKFYQLADFG